MSATTVIAIHTSGSPVSARRRRRAAGIRLIAKSARSGLRAHHAPDDARCLDEHVDIVLPADLRPLLVLPAHANLGDLEAELAPSHAQHLDVDAEPIFVAAREQRARHIALEELEAALRVVHAGHRERADPQIARAP